MFVLTSPEDHQPLALSSLLQPQIARTSALFKQFWVTGCSCQCHHLLEWDHVSSSHPASSNLTWEQCGSAGERERHTTIWKGRDSGLRAGPTDWLMWRAGADSVAQQIKENSGGDLHREQAPGFLDPYVFAVIGAETANIPSENKRFTSASPRSS